MSRRFKLKFNDAPGGSSPAVSVGFGSLTRTNAGGYPMPSGASAIASFTGTGLSVLGSNVVVTNHASPPTSGTMTFTGSSVIWNVTVTAGEYSASTSAEMEAAFAAAELASNAGTYVVRLRSGNYAATTAPYIKCYGITMAGTLSDVNNGANEASYSRSATASFTGGSITIDADTAYGPQFDGILRILGSTGIIVKNITFAAVPTSDSYNRDDGGPGTNTSAAGTFYQTIIEKNGSFTSEPSVIFKDCRFGAYNINGNPLRWGQGIRFANAKHAIVEDCDFNGVYIGCTFGAVERGVARRNAIQNMLVDGIRFMGNYSSFSSYTGMRCEATDNTIWNVSEDPDWAGAHPDGIQTGTSADTVSYSVFYKWNYLHLDVNPINHPSYPTQQRVTQGIYMDDVVWILPYDAQTANFSVLQTVTGATSGATATIKNQQDNGTDGWLNIEPVSGTFVDNEIITTATGSATTNIPSGATEVQINGIVANNFICTTTLNGMAVWRGTLDIRNNTIIKDTIHEEPGGATAATNYIRINKGVNHSVTNNICTILHVGGTYTQSGNFAVNADTSSGTASSYYDAFDGPFTVGTYGPSWTITETSAATVKASIDSIFNDKTGGGAAGIGFRNS